MEYTPFHYPDIELVRIASVDTDVEELIDEGVHVWYLLLW